MKRRISREIVKFVNTVDLADPEVWAELELRRRCEVAAKNARIQALCEARRDDEFEVSRCE